MTPIWILGATGFELAARRGGGRSGVGFVRMGMGREAVAAALRGFTPGHAGRLLAVGFAGALCDDAPVGSAWLVREARTPDGDRCRLDPAALGFARDRLGARGVGVCELLTAPHFVRRPRDKRRLGQEAGAALVDLEGYWIAREARRLQAPLVMLKVVSDAVDQQVPAAVEGRLSSLLRPGEALSLARMGWTAWGARRVLGDLTGELASAWAAEAEAAA